MLPDLIILMNDEFENSLPALPDGALASFFTSPYWANPQKQTPPDSVKDREDVYPICMWRSRRRSLARPLKDVKSHDMHKCPFLDGKGSGIP